MRYPINTFQRLNVVHNFTWQLKLTIRTADRALAKMSWARIYVKATYGTILLILCIALTHSQGNYYESYVPNQRFFLKANVTGIDDNIGFPLLRTIVQGGKIFLNGKEEEVVMNLSPTRVIRAIAAQAFEWKRFCVVIVTESKFDIIARIWQQFLATQEHILLAVVFLLKNNYLAENLQSSRARRACIATITIVLLKSGKLDIMFKNQTLDYLRSNKLSVENNRFIVVGTCLPSFIRRFNVDENVYIMILRVNTEKWLHGILPMANATLHSINRNSAAVWSTYPFKTIMKDNLLKSSIHRNEIHYGSMNNVRIHGFAYILPGIIELKDNKTIGYLGDILTHLKGYLKFSMSIKSCDLSNINDVLTLYISTVDLHIGMFVTAHRIKHKFLPALHHDGQSIFAAKLESSMKIKTLFSIFKLKVWISLLAIICGCNMCYFLTLLASPSLKNNPRMQTKSNTSLLGIACFDSLIASPAEWQMAMHLPSRWLLLSLNFLFFFASTVYLILFSVRVLADKRSFPFQNLDEICNPSLFRVAQSWDSISLLNNHVCGRAHNRNHCLKYIRYNFTSEDEDCVANGTWVVIMSKLVGTDHFKHHPYVSHYKTPICERPASMETASDFLFIDIFSKFILRLREVGILDIFLMRNALMAKKEYSIIRQMAFTETWFTFAICGIGVLMAVTALCVEKFVERHTINVKKSSSLKM